MKRSSSQRPFVEAFWSKSQGIKGRWMRFKNSSADLIRFPSTLKTRLRGLGP